MFAMVYFEKWVVQKVIFWWRMDEVGRGEERCAKTLRFLALLPLSYGEGAGG